MAHVVGQLAIGGMEKLLVEFARHADRDRFDVRFVSLSDRGTLADDIEACGWPVTALEQGEYLRLISVLHLARLFHRWNIDIVHTHNHKPLVHAGPAARLVQVPGLIHTRHGQRYQAGARSTAVFRFLARLTDRVVCVSKDSARLSIREGVAPAKVCTLWNGIDVARFGYVGPRPDGPAVMVGRLSPEKDVETLVRAAYLAVRECADFQLRIAGDGPTRPALSRLVADLGLGERVRFLGEVRDIPALLSDAGLFVLSSLTEGISLTLLEAMARGLPVVATVVGGNPELVVDGKTGFLVPPKAPEKLARAMLQLFCNHEQSRQMGRAGRDRVERHFDVRKMVAAYEQIYSELATKGRGLGTDSLHAHGTSSSSLHRRGRDEDEFREAVVSGRTEFSR